MFFIDSRVLSFVALNDLNAIFECIDYQIPATQLKGAKGRQSEICGRQTDLSVVGLCGH